MMPKLPIQLLNMFRGGNPQQIAMQMLQQNAKGNPMLENIMNMANKGDNAGIEQIARNICKAKGIDADQMMAQIKEQFK